MKRLPFLFLAFLFLLPAISPAKELPKIAVWDLVPGDIKGAYAQDLTLILTSEIMKLKKYEVYSQDNVRTLAGWTEERIKLGCTDTKCLLALGQMDISKLISGRVGKIGNTYSISLNLFDTQNARSENAISEFCRTEDELIALAQQAVRKLLIVPVETSSLPAIPSDKTLLSPTGKPSVLGEDYLLDKIFLFDKCYFAQDKFEYWVKFRQGGILEGAPRTGKNHEKPPQEPGSFKPLDGRWLGGKNKIIVNFNSLPGIPTRYVLRMEIQLENIRGGIFPSLAESSKPTSMTPFFSGTDTLKYSCFMKEWHSP